MIAARAVIPSTDPAARLLATPLCIGDVAVNNRVFLAPMSGVTDKPFRKLATDAGAGLVVSEMVAGEQLAIGNSEAGLRAESVGTGPHVVQLAGRESRWMAAGARAAEAAGADIIDINMGCPAKKVTGGASGSALMRDLDHAQALIAATVAATDRPVTLKMRLGWDDTSLNAAELAIRAEAEGVRMITVHGRTRCQFYDGTADWSAVAAVTAVVSVPVIVNGDILTLDDATEAIRLSGADGVMIGRATYGRPWLAGAIAKEAQGEKNNRPGPIAIIEAAAEHYVMMLSHYGKAVGSRAARKHLGWYLDRYISAGGEVADGIRGALLTARDPVDVHRLLGDLVNEQSSGMGAAA